MVLKLSSTFLLIFFSPNLNIFKVLWLVYELPFALAEYAYGYDAVWHVKEKVEFWEEVKIICERYHCYYESVEKHQIQNVPWKTWLFKCFHILNIVCNNIKIGTDFNATFSCSPINIFLCTVLVTLPLTLLFWWFQNLKIHQYFSDRFHNVSLTMTQMTRTQLYL